MHFLLPIAVVGCCAVAVIAQPQPATVYPQGPPSVVYRIQKLILASSDLPATERHAIIHAFQGGSYNLDGLAERIRYRLRDSGYALVEVSAPEIKRLRSTPTGCAIDVGYSLHAGSRYRLGQITFHVFPGEPAFDLAQLRAEFTIENGAFFRAHEINQGLNNLQDLYTSHGYANFGSIPKPIFDNARHTASLDIDIDQGFPVTFGKLLMDGVEPQAGIAKKLASAWGELEGRRYNPHLLEDWLKRNSENWPSESAAKASTAYVGGAPFEYNVLLRFQ